YISGVTQFTVADASLWFVTFTLIGLEAMAVTADLQLTFLRPALGGDLHGLGTLLSQGRRRFHGSVKLWVGEERDRLVAHATGTYITPN
ncbi:MAG: PaaI family thioesterase, partial [Acidimicrobiia bacterium]